MIIDQGRSQSYYVQFLGNNSGVIIYTGTGNFVQNSEFSNSGFQGIFYDRNKKENSGPTDASGGNRIPVLSDSGILKLYCILICILLPT